MSSVPTTEEIAGSARWLVQALDPASELVRIVDMDADAYRSASFLDDRMLQQPLKAHVIPWGQVEAAAAPGAREDARWIFHIGHVGSTLIARMLGDLDDVLSVREPRILRDVAMLPPERRAPIVPPVRRLLSRTFAPAETALVKATSFVGDIAAELAPGESRVLFLFASARAYIASILAGENSVKELVALEQFREQRMAGRVPPLAGSSLADKAAAAWACEMTALEAAAEKMADRKVAWADFDAMLADLEANLARIADFFGFAASADQVRAIAGGPLIRRYSKAPEYDYSPSLRRQLLAEADSHYRSEIDSALARLQSVAVQSPLLTRALERAKESRCLESFPS